MQVPQNALQWLFGHCLHMLFVTVLKVKVLKQNLKNYAVAYFTIISVSFHLYFAGLFVYLKVGFPMLGGSCICFLGVLLYFW